MQLLTVSQVAEVLSISERRTYHLIREKIIPSVTLGERQIRVIESDLQEFIDEGGRQTSTTEK